MERPYLWHIQDNMKRIIIFVLIIMVALFLRLYQLGQVPPSPNWDEVALGYNAYSIMQTGKDEYGDFLPFVLRSYDDYKPALYSYFVIPFLPIFGLDVIAVRLPSAIFGVLAVIASYFLAGELFPKFRKFFIGETTAFLLAISPWHIQFSRIGFESNVGLAFNIFTILAFLKGLKTPVFLIVAAICSAINLYIYQSEKVFTPLIVFALVLIFRKQLFQIPKKFLVSSVFVGAVIVLPMLYYTFTSSEALSRAQGVSVFSDTTPLLSENAQKLVVDHENKDFLGLVLDNRRVFYAKTVLAGYLSHFDLNWLFITGDISRHHAPSMGLLYLWELPFLLIGIYTLVFGVFDRKVKIFLLAWFFITPIPASITSGVPHAVRTLNFLPTFQIFIAIGILAVIWIASNVKYKKIMYILFSFYLLFIIFNFFYYLSQYFIQQNYFSSPDWQFGYKEAVSTVKSVENKYDKIIVSNKPHLDQSYMFFLFYLQYPPDLYQKEAKGISGGFRENHSFGKYEFRPILWETEEKNKKILYVGRPEDFPQIDKGLIKMVRFIDGKPAIKIVDE